jgi:glycosyltransferase involved in cell wall biosynthesis
MARQTKILHFLASTNTAVFGGVPRAAMDMASRLAARGHPSTILTADTEETPTAWLHQECGGPAVHDDALPLVRKVTLSRIPGVTLSHAGMRTVRAELQRCDVVHLHCVWQIGAIQIARMARAMGKPYVISTHGMLDDWCMAQGKGKKAAFLALGARAMLEKAAYIHSTATGEFAQSRKWYPQGNGAILPYIIDLQPFHELPGRALARERFAFLRDTTIPTVLFLSRLHYKKGCEHLVQAAALLKHRGIDANFIFAGTGDEPYIASLKQMSDHLGMSDRVRFVGPVRGAEKLSLYQNADLFVLPTSQENFGLVYIESLACGTPIVATKGTDIWQELDSSGCCTISDQHAGALAQTIGLRLADREGLVAMGAKARPWVFKTFGEDILVPRYEQFYARAAGTLAPEVRSAPEIVVKPQAQSAATA